MWFSTRMWLVRYVSFGATFTKCDLCRKGSLVLPTGKELSTLLTKSWSSMRFGFCIFVIFHFSFGFDCPVPGHCLSVNLKNVLLSDTIYLKV